MGGESGTERRTPRKFRVKSAILAAVVTSALIYVDYLVILLLRQLSNQIQVPGVVAYLGWIPIFLPAVFPLLVTRSLTRNWKEGAAAGVLTVPFTFLVGLFGGDLAFAIYYAWVYLLPVATVLGAIGGKLGSRRTRARESKRTLGEPAASC